MKEERVINEVIHDKNSQLFLVKKNRFRILIIHLLDMSKKNKK